MPMTMSKSWVHRQSERHLRVSVRHHDAIGSHHVDYRCSMMSNPTVTTTIETSTTAPSLDACHSEPGQDSKQGRSSRVSSYVIRSNILAMTMIMNVMQQLKITIMLVVCRVSTM